MAGSPPLPEARGHAGRPREYRIDDLARVAGMTTRNVRAYQDRGLLPPPRRSGRVALYSDTHVARLKLIGSMLERGYTTAHIAEMLSAWERGKDLADVLGVEEELLEPWSDDQPRTMRLDEARTLAGDAASFERLEALGLIKVQGQKAVVVRPQLLRSFAEMRGYGMPMHTVLALHEKVQAPLDEVAQHLVVAGAQHFATVKGAGRVPDAAELVELTEQLGRFRQLAMSSVTDTLAASMQKAVELALGAYLGHLTDLPGNAGEDAG